MKINDAVQKSIDASVLCWMATVSPNGSPSVSPKEMFLAHTEDELVIANIASGNSEKNILENPAVCVSFIDVFDQRGFMLYGNCKIVPKDDEAGFASYGSKLSELAGDEFPISSVFVIKVERIRPIIAPSYKLRPDVDYEERKASVYRNYGVTPVKTA